MTTTNDIVQFIADQSTEPWKFINSLGEAVAHGIVHGRDISPDFFPVNMSDVYDQDTDFARHEAYKLGIRVGSTNAEDAARWLVEDEDINRIYAHRIGLRRGYDMTEDELYNLYLDRGASVADAADVLLSYLD